MARTIVVGGGIIGASIAYHLALSGEEVRLLEREEFFGAESTAKCAGGIRAQFTTPVNVALSLRSIACFSRFEQEVGYPADFRQVGYLFLARDEEQARACHERATFQRDLGVPVEWLEPAEIRTLCPELELGDIVGGNFCRLDGIGDPHGILNGYIRAARDRGVVIETETPVEGFMVEDGRVVGVQTGRGERRGDRVVVAAGAWSGRLAATLGAEVPIEPVRRQIATTAPMPWISMDWPMMVDLGSGLYMHPESGGMLLGMANWQEPPGFVTQVDEAFTTEIILAGMTRMPRLDEASIASSWAGLYEVTPDHHPILDRLPGHPDVWIAAGFSGHGFMHAPACGEVMAQLIRGESPSIDVSSLALSRFQTGALPDEAMVI